MTIKQIDLINQAKLLVTVMSDKPRSAAVVQQLIDELNDLNMKNSILEATVEELRNKSCTELDEVKTDKLTKTIFLES